MRIPKLYWRGSGLGGHIIKDNWKGFPRFRLLQLTEGKEDIMEIGFSQILYCESIYNQCDEKKIIEELGERAKPKKEPFEMIYKYKFLLDIVRKSIEVIVWYLNG